MTFLTFTTFAVISAQNLLYYLDIELKNLTISNSTPNDSIEKLFRSCTASPWLILFSDSTVIILMICAITLIFAFDLFIIIDLFKSKKRVNSKAQKKEIKLTVLVISSNLAYLFVALPFSITCVFKHIYSFFHFEYSKEFFQFIYYVSIEILCFYRILEFITLFIVNKLFRKQILNVFTCK